MGFTSSGPNRGRFYLQLPGRLSTEGGLVPSSETASPFILSFDDRGTALGCSCTLRIFILAVSSACSSLGGSPFPNWPITSVQSVLSRSLRSEAPAFPVQSWERPHPQYSSSPSLAVLPSPMGLTTLLESKKKKQHKFIIMQSIKIM